jgi:hypothetical protein
MHIIGREAYTPIFGTADEKFGLWIILDHQNELAMPFNDSFRRRVGINRYKIIPVTDVQQFVFLTECKCANILWSQDSGDMLRQLLFPLLEHFKDQYLSFVGSC